MGFCDVVVRFPLGAGVDRPGRALGIDRFVHCSTAGSRIDGDRASVHARGNGEFVHQFKDVARPFDVNALGFFLLTRPTPNVEPRGDVEHAVNAGHGFTHTLFIRDVSLDYRHLVRQMARIRVRARQCDNIVPSSTNCPTTWVPIRPVAPVRKYSTS